MAEWVLRHFPGWDHVACAADAWTSGSYAMAHWLWTRLGGAMTLAPPMYPCHFDNKSDEMVLFFMQHALEAEALPQFLRGAGHISRGTGVV